MVRRRPESGLSPRRPPKTSPKAPAGGMPGASGEGVDERVLVEAAQRDSLKFDTLYELHFERVYAFAASRVWDRASAEDVTSEVFHKALASLPRFEWRGVPFVAWLLRIAANAIADRARRAERERPLLEEPAESRAGTGLQGVEMRGEELRAIENRARLFRLVGELPEVQKQVILGRFVEQQSIREIAERLGKTEGAIKQLQLRAVQSLRAQMGGGHA
jgi:RNA polymerase sigma-70 factor, ECF subfamily